MARFMVCYVPSQRESLISKFFLLIIASAAVFCFVVAANGQVNPGFPAQSAYDSHGVDTINLQSLNVFVDIPVMGKSGAFPFDFSLKGNFYVWEAVGSWQTSINNDATGGPTLYAVANGVVGTAGSSSGYIWGRTASFPMCPDGHTQTEKFSNWYIVTADQTIHWLPSSDYTDGQGCLNASFTDQVVDGSGYTLSISYDGMCGGCSSIYDRSGALVGTSGITDSNGNAITWNGNVLGTLTDTLGLTALTIGGTSNAPTYTWTDVNGGSPQANIAETTYTLRSAFGCTNINDFNHGSQSIPTSVNFPDGTAIGLAYEGTPGYPAGNVTGRLYQLTLRSGGTVRYNWNPNSLGNDGINCTYGIPQYMTRTTADGTTTYAWSPVNNGGGNWGNTTTVTDNGGNKTVYSFTGLTSTGFAQAPTIQALTQVKRYQGSSSLLTTDVYCYNAASGQPGNCATAVVSAPVTEVDVYHTINGMSNSSRSQTQYDKYGNVTYQAQYDFGASTPTLATTIVYGTWNGSNCVAVSTTVNNKPCDVLTKQNGTTVAESRYAYDAKGNLLTTYKWTGSSWLSNTTQNSYNSNGTTLAAYDLANNQTTYTYDSGSYVHCGSCTNFPFATSVTVNGLTASSTWDGFIGTKVTNTDANLNQTIYGYTTPGGTADPFGRVMSVTDPLGNEMWNTYPSGTSPDRTNSSFTFNSGNSIRNVTKSTDGLGRAVDVQAQQGPSLTTYDTISASYGWSSNYRTVATSQPCTANAGGGCSTVHTSYYDAIGRLYKTTTQSNETLTNTYTQNDVLSVLSPAPTNENNKQVQWQYDGIGRPMSSCGVMATGGYSPCSQNSGSYSGVFTTYAYTQSAGTTTVTAGRGSQSRSWTYDALGRLIQAAIPEAPNHAWNYYYDAYSTCPSGYRGVSGKLAAVLDPNGNLLCYAYDALGRLIGINANNTTCSLFYYDTSQGFFGSRPSGVIISNSSGRMIEAATSNCATTLITDEWVSYDKDGHLSDMWESTPHSGQYYHSSAGYYGNGVLNVLKLVGIFEATYGIDGEGRPNSLGTNETVLDHLHIQGLGTQVSGVSYNAASQPTNIALGTSSDQDTYTYDQYTGRMKTWTFQVGTTPATQSGTLNWNPNGTLNNLAISDGFYSGANQTCSYNPSSGTAMGYDDLGRLLNISCGTNGSIWNQTFSYDQYDNLSKSSTGPGISWSPNYDPTTNHYNIGQYDTNGNVTNDSINAFAYNEFSKLSSVNKSGTNCATAGQCLVYDAFGRIVEIDTGSSYTEVWYTQAGKTAYMNGANYLYSYWPAPGGAELVDQTDGYHFLHNDWLGSARLSSNVASQTVIDDRAFAPYGEMYNNFGSTAQNELNFTGLTQDVVTAIYDTPNREFAAYNQGRWLTPDPARTGWNQYAYPTNPNSQIDPSGLVCTQVRSRAHPQECPKGPPDGGDEGDDGSAYSEFSEDDGFVPPGCGITCGEEGFGGAVGADGGGFGLMGVFGILPGESLGIPDGIAFQPELLTNVPCDFIECGVTNFTTPGNENTDWYTNMHPGIGPDGYWVLLPSPFNFVDPAWGGLVFFKMKHKPFDSGPLNKDFHQPPESDPIEEMLQAMKEKAEKIGDGFEASWEAITTILEGGGTLVDVGVIMPDVCVTNPRLRCGPFAPRPNP